MAARRPADLRGKHCECLLAVVAWSAWAPTVSRQVVILSLGSDVGNTFCGRVEIVFASDVERIALPVEEFGDKVDAEGAITLSSRRNCLL